MTCYNTDCESGRCEAGPDGHCPGRMPAAPAAQPMCLCGDRPAAQCPGEWEPGCDLGANEKFAAPAAQPDDLAQARAKVAADRSAPRLEDFPPWPDGVPEVSGKNTQPEASRARMHCLKTWPEFFIEVKAGNKPFEVRRNDRNFQVGDVLVLQEWDRGRQDYTGEMLTKRVSYLLEGAAFGIVTGFVVMGLEDCEQPQGEEPAAQPQGETRPSRGIAPGNGLPDWPSDLETFSERSAYQRGVADGKYVAVIETAQQPQGDASADNALRVGLDAFWRYAASGIGTTQDHVASAIKAALLYRQPQGEAVATVEPDCWATLTPNGSRLVSPDEAKGRKDAYPLYAAPPAPQALKPLTNEQIDRHQLRAGDCPADSMVILISSVRRLRAEIERLRAQLEQPR